MPSSSVPSGGMGFWVEGLPVVLYNKGVQAPGGLPYWNEGLPLAGPSLTEESGGGGFPGVGSPFPPLTAAF